MEAANPFGLRPPIRLTFGTCAVLVAAMFVLAAPFERASAQPAARAAPSVKAVTQTGVGQGHMWAVAWVPHFEGKDRAAIEDRVMTLSDTGRIILWDIARGLVIDQVGQGNCQVRLDPSGRVVHGDNRTNCIVPEIAPPTPDVQHWVQPDSLSVSPDGRFAVMVGDGSGAGIDDIEAQVFDLDSRKVLGWLNRRPLAWTKSGRLIVERVDGCAPGACARSIIDPVTMSETAAPAGMVVKPQIPTAGPDEALSPSGRLKIFGGQQLVASPNGGPPRFPLQGFHAVDLSQPVFSPDGRRFALIFQPDGPVGQSRQAPAVWVFDMSAARFFQIYQTSRAALERGADDLSIEGWLSDTQLAVTNAGGEQVVVDIETRDVQPLDGAPNLISPYDPAAGVRSGCDTAPPEKRPVGRDRNVVLSGCFAWFANWTGELDFFSARTPQFPKIMTLIVHPDGTWFVKGPQDRYDTNMGAETSDIRWILPGRPWRSLPVQTFMRDYYTPGLMETQLDCIAAAHCILPFKLLPDLSKLNLLLPEVSITSAGYDPTSNTVSVTASVTEAADPTAPADRNRSGVYDLRLFRDGRLVGQIPASKPQASAVGSDAQLAVWQTDTRVPLGGDGRLTFPPVAIPADGHGRNVRFTAYAFNSSRVKGETSPPYDFRPPPIAPRPRRAYVIAIAANVYPAMPDHTLSYAVRDARHISRYLTTFLDATGRSSTGVDYTPVTITLVSDGVKDEAAKADIHAVLDRLAGRPASPADAVALADLARAGVPVGALARATPDDLVIITFAGHGWATALGDFYLLPSDARQPDAKDPASLATLVSSAELADWLRPVDAGEMALIIDACHSAASVAKAGFKPGPMGDPGLGQLAYDKGIRILAATQADDVAQESDAFGGGHGLLTYVLVDRGLADPAAGGAARDAGGGVRIDALLNFVLDKLPGVAARAHDRPPWVSLTWTPMFGPRVEAPPEPPHLQHPVLFDFTGAHSPAAVKPTLPTIANPARARDAAPRPGASVPTARVAAAGPVAKGLDLNGHCAATYGPRFKAELLNSDDFPAWSCADGDVLKVVSMPAACARQYGPAWFARLGSRSDPGSWSCSRK